ncbi:hypothetical protein DICA0_C14356 [Diutina catenulata]
MRSVSVRAVPVRALSMSVSVRAVSTTVSRAVSTTVSRAVPVRSVSRAVSKPSRTVPSLATEPAQWMPVYTRHGWVAVPKVVVTDGSVVRELEQRMDDGAFDFAAWAAAAYERAPKSEGHRAKLLKGRGEKKGDKAEKKRGKGVSTGVDSVGMGGDGMGGVSSLAGVSDSVSDSVSDPISDSVSLTTVVGDRQKEANEQTLGHHTNQATNQHTNTATKQHSNQTNHSNLNPNPNHPNQTNHSNLNPNPNHSNHHTNHHPPSKTRKPSPDRLHRGRDASGRAYFAGSPNYQHTWHYFYFLHSSSASRPELAHRWRQLSDSDKNAYREKYLEVLRSGHDFCANRMVTLEERVSYDEAKAREEAARAVRRDERAARKAQDKAAKAAKAKAD